MKSRGNHRILIQPAVTHTLFIVHRSSFIVPERVMFDDLLDQAAGLKARGEPFALATVVACKPPTSAKPGAKAIVRADGAFAGWVGGSCARPVVTAEALKALRDGKPRL